MSSACMVALDWDGRRWQTLGVLVELDEEADSTAFKPRRLTVEIDLGDDALAMVAAGHHHGTASVAIWFGTAPVYIGGVADLQPGRAGEPSVLRVVGADLDDGAMVPASVDVAMRKVNATRTAARIAAERERTEAEVEIWRDVVGGWNGEDYVVVLGPGEYGAGNGPPSVHYVPPRHADGPVYYWRIYPDLAGQTVYLQETVGRVYPWIIGRPGIESGKVSTLAYPINVDAKTIMIAGHHGTEGTVSIQGPKRGATDMWARETLNATNEYDALGRPIMRVSVSGSTVLEDRWTTTHPEAGEKAWYAVWDGTAAGLPNGAIDVVETLLSAQTSPVDYARIESLRGVLAGYTLDGSIDAPVSVWELLQSAIVPLLPVALVDTVDGVGLVHMRYDATSADARAPLEVGRDLDPMGRPVWASASGQAEISNRITVSYAPSRATAAPGVSVTVGASTHEIAARSLAIHGDRPREIVTGWVHRAAVAETVARDALLRSAVDRRVVEYAVDAAVFGLGTAREIRLGDVYTVTDTDELIADAVALVTAVRRDGSGTDVVRFLLL